MEKIIKILEEEQEALNSRNIVLNLTQEHATDWDRGKVLGQIEMLGKIMRRLAENDKTDTL